MKLNEATEIARQLLGYFGPYCDQAQIAGSIRRNKDEVKDIELVLRPKITPIRNMFGDVIGQQSDLEDYLSRLIAEGFIFYDQRVKRNGPRYKRLVLPQHAETAIELFIADEHNWGNTLAIRTGNAEFSKALVTKRLHGGLMPTDLRQEGGYLWRGNVMLSAPTEEAYFGYLGIAAADIPHPTKRNAETAARLAGKRVAA